MQDKLILNWEVQMLSLDTAIVPQTHVVLSLVNVGLFPSGICPMGHSDGSLVGSAGSEGRGEGIGVRNSGLLPELMCCT